MRACFVYCLFVCLLVCLFVCLYGYGFLSGGKKDSGVKLYTLLRLLSGMSFSRFGERWLAWTHGGDITSGMSYAGSSKQISNPAARLGGQSELGAVALS